MTIPGSPIVGVGAPPASVSTVAPSGTIIEQFAPYGSAIYGVTTYGPPPSDFVATSMWVLPPPHRVGLYDTLFVNWVLPGGTWQRQILVRSSFGVPTNPFFTDGVTVMDESTNYTNFSGFSTSFTDTNLQSGRIYYYALFVNNVAAPAGGLLEGGEWLFAAGAWGLCVTNFGFAEHFINWTPDFYIEWDNMLTPGQPLQRFYGLLGWELDWLRSEIETLFTLSDPEYIAGGLLGLLGGNVGVGYEPAIGMQRSRVLVKNAVNLYKVKGTIPGIEEAASAYSGYGAVVSLSQNLEIQLDDAAFARWLPAGSNPQTGAPQAQVTGHWYATNTGSNITVVSSPGGLLPEHANYTPIQGNPGLSGLYSSPEEYNINGYLPPDGNTNVLELQGTPNAESYSWTRNLATQAVPGGRVGAAMVWDENTNAFFMFGGQNGPGGAWLNDTWWLATGGGPWVQWNPATSPTAGLQYPKIAYDPEYKDVKMIGYNPARGVTETWRYAPSTSAGTWNQGPDLPFTNGDCCLFRCPFYGSTTLFLYALGYNSHTNATTMYVMTQSSGTSMTWNQQTGSVAPPFNMRAMAAAYDANYPRAIITGGLSPTGSPFMGTWVFVGNWVGQTGSQWGGGAWGSAATAGGPTVATGMSAGYTGGPAVGGGAMVYNQQLAVSGLVTGHVEMVGPNNHVWYWNSVPWSWTQEASGSQPSPVRTGFAYAYDTPSSAAFMYGGATASNFYESDTWKHTSLTVNDAWVLTIQQTSPAPRSFGVMVFNPTTGNIVLFGGQARGPNLAFLNDLWTWNGTTWTMVNVTGSIPAPRYDSAAAYALNFAHLTTPQNLVFLFGGVTGSTSSYVENNDLWQWNATAQTWTQITPAGTTPVVPPPRAGHAMVWDPAIGTSGGLIVFGGYSGSGSAQTYFNDTWIYDATANTWTQDTSTPVPPARMHAAFVNYQTGQSMLFGGAFGSTTPNTKLGDTWIYTVGTGWSQVLYGINPSPSPRSFPAAANVTGLGPMIFGGTGPSSTTPTDQWFFSQGVWTLFPASPSEPLPRYGAMAAFNSATSRLVFFGGIDASGLAAGDTWTFSISATAFSITECDTTNALAYGVAITQPLPTTMPYYCLSAYFIPAPSATPILRDWYMQLDWYGWNGAYLGSTAGTPITENPASWERAFVYQQAPAGTCYVGRTVNSVSPLSGATNDIHYMDAVQLEINPSTTPPPTPVVFRQANFPVTTNGTALSTQSVAWTASGDLALLAVRESGTTNNVISVRSGLTGSWSRIISYPNTGDNSCIEIWQAVVQSSGPDTITLTYTGTPGVVELVTDEISSSALPLSWQVQASAGRANALSATVSWPSLTSGTVVPEFYWGYAEFPNPGAIGSTVGFTYVATSGLDNLVTFNPSLATSTAYAPTATQSPAGQSTSAAVIVTALYPVGPASAWTPPRDIQINLLPNRQNLAVNTQGLANAQGAYGGSFTYGWTCPTGTLAATQNAGTGLLWALDLRGGWSMTTNGSGNFAMASLPIPTERMSWGGDMPVSSVEEINSTFVASFYVKLGTTQPSQWVISFAWFDVNSEAQGADYIVPVAATPGPSDNGFTRLYTLNPVRPPDGAEFMVVGLAANNVSHSLSYLMTAPLIEPGAALLPYFDGMSSPQPDCFFEGVPNASYTDYYPNLAPRIGRLISVLPDYTPVGSTYSLFVGAPAFENAVELTDWNEVAEPEPIPPPLPLSAPNVVVTGYPARLVHITVYRPATARATVTGYVVPPTIGPSMASPIVTVTANAPTVNTMPTGVVVVTGYQPNVNTIQSTQWVTPPSPGIVPVVAPVYSPNIASNPTGFPSRAAIAVAGLAPSVSGVTANRGAVAVTGRNASVTIVNATTPTAGVGAATAAGSAPYVTIPNMVPDVVQNTQSINFGAVNPATASFAAATTVGNTLIAVIGTGNSSTVSSVTGLGTWVKAASLVGCEIWYCLACTTSGTATTITWSAAPSASATACLLEIPHCTALDVTNTASGSAAGALGPGVLAPTVAGDFFIAGFNCNGTPSNVNGHMATMNNSGDINVVYQYQTSAQQNAYTPVWTTTAGAWVAVGAAFKVATPRTAYTVTNNTHFVTSEQYPRIDVYERDFHAFYMPLWGADDNLSALSPDRTRLWQTINIPSVNCGALQIIDTSAMTGIYAIQYPAATPTDPVQVVFSPDGTKVYCANAISHTITVYNASTYALIATIPTGTAYPSPHRMAVSPDGTKLYATNGGDGTVVVIDTATNTVTNTITVGNDPWEVAFTPTGTYAYVADGAGNHVTVITVATNAILTTITTGGGAHGVGITPDGTRVYMSNNADGTVSVINTATNTVVAGPITTGTGAATVRVTLDGTEVWVANNGTNTVSIISVATNTVKLTLTIGTNPASNPNGLSL